MRNALGQIPSGPELSGCGSPVAADLALSIARVAGKIHSSSLGLGTTCPRHIQASPSASYKGISPKTTQALNVAKGCRG